MSENLVLNVKLAEISAKDPDELIKENPSLWKESLKKAVSGYEFVFNKTISAYPTLDQNSIRKITRDLVPILRKIDNEITRSHYERLLAAKLEVDVTSVRIEVQKGADNFRDSREEKKLPLTQNERESLEKYLLSLIFQLGTLPKEITNLDFEIEKNRAFFEIAVNTTKENKIDVKVISEKIPQEFVELFNEISLRDLQENLLDQEKTLDEIKTCATRLKELNLRTRLKEASLAIKQAELRHEDQKLEILTKQFKTLSDQLSIIEKARET